MICTIAPDTTVTTCTKAFESISIIGVTAVAISAIPELIAVIISLIADPNAVITGASPLNELIIELIAIPAAKIRGDNIANAEATVGNTGATITKA